MPTPETTAQVTQSATGAATALQLADQLEQKVAMLKRELRGYNDDQVVGRDTAKLREYITDIHQFCSQIGQQMGIVWGATSSGP